MMVSSLALVVDADNFTAIVGRLATAFVVVQTDPVPWTIDTTAALMLDWSSATGWAEIILTIVETSGGPEGVVVLVEDVLVVEGILDELNIALEEFTFTGTFGIA